MLKFETTIGACGLRWSEAGITEVLMPGDGALAGEPGAISVQAPETVRRAVTGIVSLLAGERTDLRWVSLDENSLDPFPRAVYAAAREIPAGSTTSYGEIARTVGAPNSAREVGGALGRNPFPIIVPCHRVLAATGALHGFSAPGGIATKRRMLEIENAPGFTQQLLFA
jgi:methylated-DNA-[protein]-cysteine S-methyltransferase